MFLIRHSTNWHGAIMASTRAAGEKIKITGIRMDYYRSWRNFDNWRLRRWGWKQDSSELHMTLWVWRFRIDWLWDPLLQTIIYYREVRLKKEVLTLSSNQSNRNTIIRYLGMYTTAFLPSSLYFEITSYGLTTIINHLLKTNEEYRLSLNIWRFSLNSMSVIYFKWCKRSLMENV